MNKNSTIHAVTTLLFDVAVGGVAGMLLYAGIMSDEVGLWAVIAGLTIIALWLTTVFEQHGGFNAE